MLAMPVILREPAWPELAGQMERVIHLGNESAIQVSGLPEGMASGKPSVVFRLDLPDGRIVLAETSLALLLTAADILQAAFGDPRE